MNVPFGFDVELSVMRYSGVFALPRHQDAPVDGDVKVWADTRLRSQAEVRRSTQQRGNPKVPANVKTSLGALTSGRFVS